MKHLMQSKSIFQSLTVALVIGFFGLTSQQAQGQLSNLDDGRFIEGLGDHGMQELLLHFLEKANVDDPLLKLEIGLAQAKMLFENQDEEPANRAKGVDQALDTWRKMLKEHPAHWKRMIWRINMTEYILITVLPQRYNLADHFYEFGVSPQEQEKAFESLVAEAATLMEEARNDWFILQGDLPRRNDFVQKFENNGVWRRLRMEFGALKLPFYHAWVHYYASLLPGANSKENRKKFEDMLAQAEVDLKAVKAQPINPATLARVESLRGRVLIQQEKYAEAIKYLDRTLAMDVDPRLKYDSQIAKAYAIYRGGDLAGAVKHLEEVRGEIRKRGVGNDIFRYVISYDAEHRILLEVADKIKDKDQRKVAENKAWEVFENLKQDKAIIAAGIKNAIEEFIDGRLVGDPNDEIADVANAQPAKVVALIKAKLQAGQKNMQTDKAQAKKYLDGAIKLILEFVKREDLPKAIEAQARFNLGFAYYLSGKQADAAVAWIDCGEKLPEMSISARGMDAAATIVTNIYQGNKTNTAAIGLFERGHSILQEKFANSDVAQKHAYSYASYLRTKGKFDEAIKFFDRVPANFQFYPHARYEQTLSRFLIWQNTAKDKARIGTEFIPQAKTALIPIEKTLSRATGNVKKDLKLFVGDITAMLIEVYLKLGGPQNMALAQGLMKNFETDYAEYPALVNQIERLRITNMIDRGEIVPAQEAIQKFVEKFPNQGGPMIKGILEGLDRQIEQLKELGQSNDAKKLANISANMAKLLFDWASRQPAFKKPEALMPFEIQYGKQLLYAHDNEKALALFKKLAEGVGSSNIEVILMYGEALFQTGDYKGATTQFNRIILDNKDNNAPEVWHSWIRVLQRQDMLYEEAKKAGNTKRADQISAKNIYQPIRQRENLDANFGGKFKSEYLRLKLKHAPR